MQFPIRKEAETMAFSGLAERIRLAMAFAKEKRFAPNQAALVSLLGVLEHKANDGDDAVRSDWLNEWAALRYQVTLWVLAYHAYDTTKLDPGLGEHKRIATPNPPPAPSPEQPSIPTERVPWELLPEGEIGEMQLRKYLHDYSKRHPNSAVDIARIDFALSLGPERRIIGKAGYEFDGYVAFTFPFTSRVLLDCPLEGNAAYVFGEDWKELSKLSKAELLGRHQSKLTRIIHRESGWWRVQIREALRATREQPELPLL